MKSITICLNQEEQDSLTELNRLLYKKFQLLSDLEIGFHTYIQKETEFYLVTCQFWSDHVFDSIRTEKTIEAVSFAIAEFIVEFKEKEICEEILKHEQESLEETQLQKLIKYIHMLIDGSNEQSKRNKINWIASQAKKCFLVESQLVLEGFIRFRLKKYGEDLHRLIEYARDEYLIEKELSSHIEALKSLVTKQDAKLEQLHIIHLDDRNLYLYDQDWRRLYPYLINGICLELGGRKASYEDLVISVIISLAPSHVKIHTNHESQHIVYTIKKIFAARVDVCSECNDCKGNRSAK